MSNGAAYSSPDDLAAALDGVDYLADPGVATAAFLALQLGRPLFLEGEAGVGKTALAHALAKLAGAPLIRLHPETGRKQIYANELYTQRILGLSRSASQGLLEVLFDLVRSPDVQTRFRWQQGTALIWDNRTVLHSARGGYDGHRRVMHRTTVAGERPIAVTPRPD